MLDTGDTAFMLVATALVMLMTAGLAFFYGGLVRSKNVLTIKMQSFVALGVVAAVWAIVGYTLAFGSDWHGLIGGLQFVGLRGVGMEPYAPTIPHELFMVFQMMFAIITPALISGAFAYRMRFSSYIAFIVIWLLAVYVPLAHWIWGGGFLQKMGVLDFAGGYVVHMSAGFAALACVFVFRPRKIPQGESAAPHNVPFVALGAGLLWFGWFGFNAGSALAADGIAANAFVTTMLGGSFGMLSWMTVNWMVDGKPSASGAVTGAVAGLATITPASGFVAPWAGALIGLLAGLVCFAASKFRARRKWDDALDVWACHGVGGTLGVLATGAFAAKAINGQAGLIEGGTRLFLVQAAAAVFVAVYAFGVTYAILRMMKAIRPIEVSEADELASRDLHEHGESAYQT